MGKKILFGNNEAILLTENEKDVKLKVLDYLYNTLNLSKYRYGMLDGVQKLKFLQENEHYVSPNFKGLNYFLILMMIGGRNYSVLVNRKKLSYHKNQLDVKTVFIVKVNVNTNNNMYSGTIFDGKLVQKEDKNYFLIQDCFNLMGKNITDMELNQKMLYLNDIINTNLSSQNVCLNFNIKLNKLYTYEDIPELINTIMPKCNISYNGIVFYPKYSGISIIHIEKKNEKIDIQTNNTENINTQSQEVINGFIDLLKSRTYSYEKEGKQKILWIKKTDTPDVYNLYEKKDDNKLCIAHIPNIKISHYCAANIGKTHVKINCIFNNKINKWIPLNIVN